MTLDRGLRQALTLLCTLINYCECYSLITHLFICQVCNLIKRKSKQHFAGYATGGLHVIIQLLSCLGKLQWVAISQLLW